MADKGKVDLDKIIAVARRLAGENAEKLPRVRDVYKDSYDIPSAVTNMLIQDPDTYGVYLPYKEEFQPLIAYKSTQDRVHKNAYPSLFPGQDMKINVLSHEYGHGAQYQGGKKSQADRDTLYALLQLWGKDTPDYLESEANILARYSDKVLQGMYSDKEIEDIRSGRTIPRGSILKRKVVMPKDKLEKKITDELKLRAERIMVEALSTPEEFADADRANVWNRYGKSYINPDEEAFEYYRGQMSPKKTRPYKPYKPRGFVER